MIRTSGMAVFTRLKAFSEDLCLNSVGVPDFGKRCAMLMPNLITLGRAANLPAQVLA